MLPNLSMLSNTSLNEIWKVKIVLKKSCVGGGDPITNRSETAPTAILPAELSFVCQTLSPDISNINNHRFDAPRLRDKHWAPHITDSIDSSLLWTVYM